MAERYPLRPDPRGGAAGGNAPESDPLAELARLIGQTDPFGAMGRANARVQQPAPAQAAPTYQQQAPQDYGQQHEEPVFENPGRPAWLRNLPQYRDEAQHAPQQYGADEQAEVGWHQPQQDDAPHDASRYDNLLYGQQGQDQHQYPHAGQYDARQHDQQGQYQPDAYSQHGHAGYEQQHDAYQHQQGYPQPGQQGYDPYQRDAYPYRAEEEEPVEVDKRKAGLVTALLVLAFAFVGVGGAYAVFSYRTSRNGEPPVIRADASPTKIAPSSTSDPSGKINDRVSGSPERLVPREEQPVDVRDQTKARVVLSPTNQVAPNVVTTSNANASVNAPGPARNTGSNFPPPNSSAMPTPNAAGEDPEPKRLKTITIRNGNVVAPATPSVTPSPSAPVQNAPPAKRAAATPASPSSSPPPATRSVTPPPPAASSNPTGGRLASPPDSNLPMPITPRAQSSVPDNRVAAVQPTARVPEPTAGGGYVVQLASQQTEAEARNSFRSYQTKFGSVMAGRQLIIKPVDFGAKGRWFRAQTGPFASSEEASEFCKSLTAAGGNCIVQRN